MFEDKQKQYNLTDDEVKKFCQLGCSVDCDIFLKEYARRLDKKKRINEIESKDGRDGNEK